MTTREILCLLPSAVAQIPNLIDDLESRWYAKVDNDTLGLKTLAVSEVSKQCEKGSCILFHGRRDPSDFKSQLSPTVTDLRIPLPQFDPSTNSWTLQVI